MSSTSNEARRYCRACGAANPVDLDRCRECQAMLRGAPLGGTTGELAALLTTIQDWRRHGLLTVGAFTLIRSDLKERLTAIRGRSLDPAPPLAPRTTTAAAPWPASERYVPRPAASRPSRPSRQAPAPRARQPAPIIPVGVRRASARAAAAAARAWSRAGSSAAARARAFFGPAAAAARSPQEFRASLSWERIGAALFSERTLQALLYLGAALVVAATLTLTVTSFRSDAPWLTQQAILIVGGLNFLVLGTYARERVGLRLSGGVLLDLGALWIPLNVGVACYQLFGWSGGAEVLGIPLNAPLSWLVISAATAPAYILLSYRFHLILPAYGAAVAAGVAVAAALNLLEASWEWQLAAPAVLAPVLAIVARRIRRDEFATIARHMLWLSYGWAPALLLAIVAVHIDERSPEAAPLALAMPAWAAVAAAALHAHARRGRLDLYLPLAAVPAAVVLTLRGVPALPPLWYGAVFVVLAQLYLHAGAAARARLEQARTSRGPQSLSAIALGATPEQVVAAALALIALGFAQTPATAAAILALVASFQLAARRELRHPLFEYLAVVAFAPVPALAWAAAAAPTEALGAVVAATGLAYIVGSRVLRRWMLAPARPPRFGGDAVEALAAFGPLGAAGLALSVAALLIATRSPGSAAATQAIVAVALLTASQLHRRAILEYAAAALLPLPLVLALVAVDAPVESYGLALALLAGVTLVGARLLRRWLLAPPRAVVPGSELVEVVRSFGSFGAVAIVVAGYALLVPEQTAVSAALAQLAVAIFFGFAAFTYRLAVLEYVAVGLLPVALVSASVAAGAPPIEWYGVMLAALAAGYFAAGWLLRGRLLAPPSVVAPHFTLPRGILALGSPGLVALVLGVAAVALYPQQTAATASATQLLVVALLAAAALLHRRQECEYAAVALVPVAAAHAAYALGAPLAGIDVLLAAVGLGYVLGARWLRYRQPAHDAFDLLRPYYLGGLAVTLAAVAWPEATIESRMLALYVVTTTVGSSALILGLRPLVYLAALLLFAPFTLTIAQLEVPPHTRTFALFALAVAELGVAELLMLRHAPWLPLRRLIVGAPPRPLFANPIFVAGSLGLLGSLVLASVDLEAAPEAMLAPWTFAAIAATLAVGAVARRSTLLAHAAAWLALPAFVLLGERGFYVTDAATTVEHARNLAVLAAVYLAGGVALDRFARRFAGALLLPAYIWPFAAIAGTTPERALNVAVIGGVAALYAATALLVHLRWHRWFLETLARAVEAPAVRAHARNVFLYAVSLLVPIAVLLALSLTAAAPEHYGFALVAMAAAYLAAGRLSRRVDLTHRHAWYLPGYAMSVAGPLTAVSDIDAFLATLGVAILLYA